MAKLTKAEMVRQAIAAGHESPTAGVAWIKETHGVEVSPQAYSAYKAQERERQERGQEAETLDLIGNIQELLTQAAQGRRAAGALVEIMGSIIELWGFDKLAAAIGYWQRSRKVNIHARGEEDRLQGDMSKDIEGRQDEAE